MKFNILFLFSIMIFLNQGCNQNDNTINNNPSVDWQLVFQKDFYITVNNWYETDTLDLTNISGPTNPTNVKISYDYNSTDSKGRLQVVSHIDPILGQYILLDTNNSNGQDSVTKTFIIDNSFQRKLAYYFIVNLVNASSSLRINNFKIYKK
jgi:hypothetical protein